MLNSVVVVDTFEGCLSEAGDLLHLIEKGTFSEKDIHADLAQLVTGKKSGRRNRDEITLFMSVGYALEDLVTAGFAYHKANDQGIGTPLDFACAMCAGRNGDVK